MLRQQVLITAKLRGRHSIFLFGVIAASPCCTWYTGQSAEVHVLYRQSALHDQHAPFPEASTLPSCQSASALYWWKWHVSASVQASVYVHTVPRLLDFAFPNMSDEEAQARGTSAAWASDRPRGVSGSRRASMRSRSRSRSSNPESAPVVALRPSLRCRRFVQLLPRRGAPRWTSRLLKLGGSFREVSRQTRWPNTIGRTLRAMRPLRELFKPCFGHLRVSRHLRRAQGSLMLTSTVMESIILVTCAISLAVSRYRVGIAFVLHPLG